MRVAEPLGHPRPGGGAVDGLVDGLRGEPFGLLGAAVAAQAHEDELIVAQTPPAR